MITRVRARNFKSLREVDYSLGPLNAMVGPNMGGKSNVINQFCFLQECSCDAWLRRVDPQGPVAGEGAPTSSIASVTDSIAIGANAHVAPV